MKAHTCLRLNGMSGPLKVTTIKTVKQMDELVDSGTDTPVWQRYKLKIMSLTSQVRGKQVFHHQPDLSQILSVGNENALRAYFCLVSILQHFVLKHYFVSALQGRYTVSSRPEPHEQRCVGV